VAPEGRKQESNTGDWGGEGGGGAHKMLIRNRGRHEYKEKIQTLKSLTLGRVCGKKKRMTSSKVNVPGDTDHRI